MPLTLRIIAFALLLAAGAGHAQSTAATPAAAKATSARDAAAAPKKIVRNPAFYSAEVPLNSPGEKRGATLRALAQVVVRLTGDRKASSNPTIRRASANLDALVLRSDVRQLNETVNGLPVYKSVLAVSFDPEGVDTLIAGAGLKFWSSDRPKPILWLAIDDGRGPRLVTGQQPNVVKPLATRGLERGMRYLLPAGTAVEQAAVSSILALNTGALQVLTSRYRNDAQLVGKVYRQPPGWAADWVLTQAGTELARWSFTDADPRRVIASGVDDGADALARRDGVTLDTGTPGLFLVEVTGVRTQGDFIRLMSYLQSLAVVRKVTAVEADSDRLRLQLDLGVGLKGFNGMLATGSTLRLASDAPVGGVLLLELQ